MKLKSSRTFWPAHNPRFKRYAPLKKDLSCDIVIVGGGIIGALLAYHLSGKGHSVVLVDKREVGQGSTSASTALLLYELDVALIDLVKKIGKKKALRVYRLSLESLATLQRLSQKLGIGSAYRKKKSLYLASKMADVPLLKKDYLLRKKHGFRVRFLQGTELQKLFGIAGHAAIISTDAAEVDPYLLTHSLLQHARKRGLKIFSRTEVTSISSKKNGESVLHTTHADIHAKHALMATGYESQSYLRKKVVDLKSSYVIVSEPVANFRGHWLRTHLLWESARPYFYIRTTNDNRIMLGGEDEEVINDKKRDALIAKKAKMLQKKFKTLVPDIPFDVAYAWSGTFGETKDGTGFVGIPPEWKNVHFALGFGGNGITFGVIAAEMIAKTILGKKPRDAALFSFKR